MRTKYWAAAASMLALSPVARTSESDAALDPSDFRNYWDAASWDREGGSRFWHLAAPTKKVPVRATRNQAPARSATPTKRPANSYQTPVVPPTRKR